MVHLGCCHLHSGREGGEGGGEGTKKTFVRRVPPCVVHFGGREGVVESNGELPFHPRLILRRSTTTTTCNLMGGRERAMKVETGVFATNDFTQKKI